MRTLFFLRVPSCPEPALSVVEGWFIAFAI